MDIIKEFQQFPKAWDAFVEWGVDNYSHAWDIITDLDEAQIRYLLADMQAWLDSVGIYCDANISYLNHYPFDAKVCVGKKMEKAYNDVFATRPEALYASIEKGLEIFEQTKQ